MKMENIRKLIKKHPIFRNADDTVLSTHITESDVALCEFSQGSEICSPLSKEVPVGLLVSGKARVYSADAGNHVLLKSISDGVIFGIATLYSKDSPFPTRICAQKQCTVLFISPDAVRSLIENDKNVMRDFMTTLSTKIVYLNKKISSLTAGSTERKLSVYLIDNADNGVYEQNISASAIAAMLDIGRASLYRAFDKLEAEGFIERRGKTVIIKDEAAMLKRFSR